MTGSHRYNVAGVYAAYERIRNMEMAAGRFLSEEDVLHRRRVVVIGENVRKELFSGLPAVGSEIKINGARFTVVGVLKKKTQITNYAAPDDMTAFMPYTTFSALANTRYLNNIVMLPANNSSGTGLSRMCAPPWPASTTSTSTIPARWRSSSGASSWRWSRI